MWFEYLICVATINGPARLEAFVESVFKYTDPSKVGFKISIADDHSIPELAEKNWQVAAKYNCLYRRNEERRGVPYTWNRACEMAESEWIIIANDDIEVVPGWLDAHKAFVSANSDKQLGALSWPITNYRKDQSFSRDFVVGPDPWHIEKPVVSPAGCLFAFKRDLWKKVWGFDERYFATWEEVDFGGKLSMLGYKQMGMSDPLIFHENSASFSDPLNRLDPAFERHALAQGQWIDKWTEILSIDKTDKPDSELILEISNRLTDMQAKYTVQDFNKVRIQV